MKLIRYADSAGTIGYGSLQADGSALVVTGDIFGKFDVTSKKADVKKLLAPLLPVNLFCIGLNYRKHAAEGNAPIPEFPVVFMKATTSIQNPGDPIVLPRHLASSEVDYECELAVVIGKKCKNVAEADALNYVLGYTCANDISARDWQGKWGGSQWVRGKTFDTFAPIGPSLVLKDEIPDPAAMRIRTILNGEVMQDWHTDDMIFSVPKLIAFLSGSTTLLPGTLILTGTPHGVGFSRKPPVWLQPGNKITVDIDKIGELTNPIVAEEK